MDRRVTQSNRVTSLTWGPPPPCKQTFRQYRAFSLTWLASMQIYWNSRERLNKEKKLNSDRTGMGHQHGGHFIVLGHQYGRRDVM